MTYTANEQGTRVTIEMTGADYATLLMIVGFALGGVSDDEERAWILTFVNELNRTNPNYKPYVIP